MLFKLIFSLKIWQRTIVIFDFQQSEHHWQMLLNSMTWKDYSRQSQPHFIIIPDLHILNAEYQEVEIRFIFEIIARFIF